MPQEYKIGVMRTVVEEETPPDLSRIVDKAVERVEEILADNTHLSVEVFDFIGPHLTPVSGAYSPLDFLRMGLTEKVERDVHFMLIVTEVDLSAASLSYVLAMPSRLTNVGIISSKRLNPSFWGQESNSNVMVERLTGLMLHTLGHLFNLSHDASPDNVMYDFQAVEQLERMTTLSPAQEESIRRHLPQEAREETSENNRWSFALRQIAQNLPSIGRTLLRAHPFNLITKLPTMLTAALSVAVVLFFTAEVWDVGSSLQYPSLSVFSSVAVAFATAVLYRSFNIGRDNTRSRALTESAVVTATATLLAFLLTILLIYLLFFGITLLSAVTFFPMQLKETWPTADPASALDAQIRLSMFIAGMGVLTGSLGSAADSKQLIRQVLFMDEES